MIKKIIAQHKCVHMSKINSHFKRVWIRKYVCLSAAIIKLLKLVSHERRCAGWKWHCAYIMRKFFHKTGYVRCVIAADAFHTHSVNSIWKRTECDIGGARQQIFDVVFNNFSLQIYYFLNLYFPFSLSLSPEKLKLLILSTIH